MTDIQAQDSRFNLRCQAAIKAVKAFADEHGPIEAKRTVDNGRQVEFLAEIGGRLAGCTAEKIRPDQTFTGEW
ncbi:hypothetical protein [Nitratireductor sp. GCM10026969]|uniref:hypothetical protein n=1 Tax=Nitratireductor sp. GCM10026969 TaxID=3252645 RepID=UPI003608F7ED